VATLLLRICICTRKNRRSPPVFCAFTGEARSADALYILGDLFEAWIGDDDPTPLHRQIAAAIKALVDSGIPCYFLHGNRDFLVGQRFARESGMTLLPEEQVLDLYGRNVLIMHGDTLCTDDAGYLAFRAKVHNPWIQRLFLALPLFIRRRIAARMRADSKAANSGKSMEIMDVNPQAVVDVMEKHHVQWLIHGHTHRPDVHSLTANGEAAHRVVLGAWHSEGSMVKVTPEDVALVYFPFQDQRLNIEPDASLV
jgi:UDP-2,3-diacylglucosamine hydrolase